MQGSTTYIGVIEQEKRKVFSEKFPNQLAVIVQALAPFRSAVAGIVVRSTYNWYWLKHIPKPIAFS